MEGLLVELAKGQVAVVTGAASGIGFALAERFAGIGMSVVLADVEELALRDAADRLTATAAGSPSIVPVVTDVSDGASVAALADDVHTRFGAVDVLCNNAGVSFQGRTWEASVDDWRWVLGVNLWGVVHGIRCFVPEMIAAGRPGHVVNTASGAGLFCLPGLGLYSVAKHGVIAASETLAQELRADGHDIGVSVLCPSYTATNIATASRNRPVALGGHPTPRDLTAPPSLSVPDGTQAEMLVPGDVAATVADAIGAGRFWVFTHPHTSAIVARWAQAMEAGETFFGGDDPHLRSR